MTTATTDVRNYFKLELLIDRAQITLRQVFKNRYTLFYPGSTWDDTPTCGSNYLTNVIMTDKRSKRERINPTSEQKTAISNGDSNQWDIALLLTLLLHVNRPTTLDQQQVQRIDQENVLLEQLKDQRNKIIHHPSKSVDDIEFNQRWSDLTTVLVSLGDIDSELDKLKDDSIFDDRSQPINQENVEEAKRLNSLGTQAHKDGKYADAIEFFTEAIVLSSVADHDRAVFYSNMSSSRLALYEQQASTLTMFETGDTKDERYRALQDAKKARSLWLIWWKGHYRVGKAYASMNDHKKAIDSYEKALALDPSKNETQKALNESRQIHGRELRQEHLDPRLQPITMVEHLNELQQKVGIDPQKVRAVHSRFEKAYPSGADVVRGHKYEHGDIGVKQDYEQAAKYFEKAANQGNAEGLYNLARLTDLGFGVKKDHERALKLLKQAAEQSPQHPLIPGVANVGVAEAEHALGLRYFEGITVSKNLSIAAYWYQRAADHGSAQAANNLAIMYYEGRGVERNVDNAQQLFELSATRGDPNAMLSLAQLSLDRNDLQMAKIWFDRACESGNVVAQTTRESFEKTLHKKQQLIDQCSSSTLQMMTAMDNILASVETVRTAHKQLDQPRIYDYNVLTEHANRGSITAKRMCSALKHFYAAFKILIQNDTLTEEQENTFVHELSQCYRLEHIVAQFSGVEMRENVDKIVDRVLQRCTIQLNDGTSQLDEDARLCYVVSYGDSHALIVKFLETCKRKYPKSISFFEFAACVHGFLNQYELTLYNANNGLEIDPNYVELYYEKAVALRLIGKDMDEAIRAYETFLAIAPKDHRKAPESYYAIGTCYLARDKNKSVKDIIKKVYEQGEEAEKIQLPCFLPYKSNSKKLLKPFVDPESLLNTESAPVVDHKTHLTNLYRIEAILQHRQWQSFTFQNTNYSKRHFITRTNKPRLQQQAAKSLAGLKPISLKEIARTKDHIYNGYVLSVTIIEEAYSWAPSIHLIIEDENLDCERMCIYGFPEDHGKYLTSQAYTIGSKMHIINPYLRIGSTDMKAFIRVDDYSSIVLHDESERIVNMCRCCGEANAPHVCSKCEQARYCSKECQTMDWKTYKHKLICGLE